MSVAILDNTSHKDEVEEIQFKQTQLDIKEFHLQQYHRGEIKVKR